MKSGFFRTMYLLVFSLSLTTLNGVESSETAEEMTDKSSMMVFGGAGGCYIESPKVCIDPTNETYCSRTNCVLTMDGMKCPNSAVQLTSTGSYHTVTEVNSGYAVFYNNTKYCGEARDCLHTTYCQLVDGMLMCRIDFSKSPQNVLLKNDDTVGIPGCPIGT